MLRRTFVVAFVAVLLALVACKKQPSATPLTTKCTKDADCTFSHKARGECCVNPCGGSAKAVHVDEAAAINAYNTEACTPDVVAKCPQAGACAQPPPAPGVAKCRAGACTEEDPAKN